jgi:hypothetical protein
MTRQFLADGLVLFAETWRAIRAAQDGFPDDHPSRELTDDLDAALAHLAPHVAEVVNPAVSDTIIAMLDSMAVAVADPELLEHEPRMEQPSPLEGRVARIERFVADLEDAIDAFSGRRVVPRGSVPIG